jgi:hypothetical protein
VLRECHRIWFTGFETVGFRFDDGTDNAPTSWVPDCCFILKKEIKDMMVIIEKKHHKKIPRVESVAKL